MRQGWESPSVTTTQANRKRPGNRGRFSAGFYDTHVNAERAKRNHIRQLEALGYTVTLQPAA
jgi:hypothetical protein